MLPPLNKMSEYHYKMNSSMNGIPLSIDSIIYAENPADADRLFYWKILTEFQPTEYADIITNAHSSILTVEELDDIALRNANRGIILFTAILSETDIIRSLEKTRIAIPDEDWFTLYRGGSVVLKVDPPKTDSNVVKELICSLISILLTVMGAAVIYILIRLLMG